MQIQEKNIHAETTMPSLKTLAVDLMHTPEGHINEHYINWFMQLLKVFPCLETVYIKVNCSGWSLNCLYQISTPCCPLR